jgi:2-oxoglutarate ferredoxin oxidoreductase subunit alpha
MDYTIRIGGEAGQGLQTIGGTLARIFSRLHYHVFTHQDYMSRIRGGHNYYQIRISENPLTASRDPVHVLVALDKLTIDTHRDAVHEKGVILFDPEDVEDEPGEDLFLSVPFVNLAEEEGGSKIMANTVAVGAILGLFGMDLEPAEESIRESLAKKSDKIIEGNLKAMRAGYDHVRENKKDTQDFSVDEAQGDDLMLINGIQGIALGAIMAGCKFYSAYPMTPSTGIMVYLAAKEEEHNIIVEQAEDEISAINMALGASFAGVRAMTGTSGGGYALMTEGVSLAGMTETPIVICEMQRPGPATGLPTRTEQGDLFFVLHGGHGEFPRVVLTPGTPEQGFRAVNKAFDLAEKYQIPVFVQGDQYLADAEWTCARFATDKLKYRDYRLRGGELEKLVEYRRYAFTENGISPLAVPGESKHLVVVDSDEHDEEGHIIEDAETRTRMVEKRLHKKMVNLRREISPPELYGAENPDIILLCFGSNYGVTREVVEELQEGRDIAMLHFSEVYPFPLTESFDYVKLLQQARQTVCIENNATGQFARLLFAETGFACSDRVNRYDGRPFTADSLLEEVSELLEKAQEQ